MHQIVPQGRTKLHSVRFYNIAPRSIQCMAYNKLQNKLAIARNDGTIEIWDVQYSPYLQDIIPKGPGGSVEDIAWFGHRLFTVGLAGYLVEWDLQALTVRRKQFVTGNAIWCMDVCNANNELTVGTEEGYINIIDIANDEIQYKNLFDKQEGRVLCCKYDHTGEYLVTGSVGVIRIWKVKSGQAIHKLTLARLHRNKKTIVWSLCVLSDFTIVSGDSRGIVTVWDGHTASHLESHQALKADVLTLAVNDNETQFMCAGIDPLIKIYAKTNIKREDSTFTSWIKLLQRQVHSHDIKTLLTMGDCILSGGIDGYLGISSAVKTSPQILKFGPFLKNPCAATVPNKNLLLLRYMNYLEVWRLGSAEWSAPHTHTEGQQTVKLLPLAVMPEKLLELKCPHGDIIINAAISPDANWLCYSTQRRVSIFRLSVEKSNKQCVSLKRILDTPTQFTNATHIVFTMDSKRIYLLNAETKTMTIFALLPNEINELDFVESVEMGKHIKDRILNFIVSPCSLYVAVVSADKKIGVWCAHKGKTFQHHLMLPRYTALPTAITIHGQHPHIVTAYSDGKLIEYDLEEMCFTCSDVDILHDKARGHCIKTIVVDSRNPNMYILHNDDTLFVVEKTLSQKAGKAKVKKTANQTPKTNQIARLSLKYTKTFEHLIQLCTLSQDEIVAITVSPNSLLDQLPGVYKKPMFGS